MAFSIALALQANPRCVNHPPSVGEVSTGTSPTFVLIRHTCDLPGGAAALAAGYGHRNSPPSAFFA